MPIENRNLEPGTVLSARYKKEERTCEVVRIEDGLRFKTDDGELFNSPSSAAKHVMGGIAANGWRFWSLQGTEPARRERTPKAEKPAKRATARPAKKAAAKPKKGAPKRAKGKAMRAASNAAQAGRPSFGCGVCGETFPTTRDATAHLTAAHACE